MREEQLGRGGVGTGICIYSTLGCRASRKKYGFRISWEDNAVLVVLQAGLAEAVFTVGKAREEVDLGPSQFPHGN